MAAQARGGQPGGKPRAGLPPLLGGGPDGGLRRPFFAAAVVVLALAVLAEVGLAMLLGSTARDPVPRSTAGALGVTTDVLMPDKPAAEPPGAGIGFLAFLDGLLLFTVLMLGLSLIMNLRTYGRVQGMVTLVVAFLWMLATFFTALAAFAKLLLMIGLLVATPFGTMAYLALWGSFPVTEAAAVLGLVLLLKTVFVVLLLLSQPAFLKTIGLVVLLAVSVLLQLILGLIHGLLPGPLVSIGDQFWALVTVVVALAWALVMLIGSIPAIINALRVSGSAAD